MWSSIFTIRKIKCHKNFEDGLSLISLQLMIILCSPKAMGTDRARPLDPMMNNYEFIATCLYTRFTHVLAIFHS